MRIYKHHILYTIVVAIIFILSLVFIENNNNVSALSYESSIGVGFTFEPTLSINLSSSDLVIPNLVPGSSSDSNSINVSVATNAAYGYTLSANVGSSDSSSPYYNSSDLIHSNNNGNSNNVFSSIAIDANLSNLEEYENDNIWGYSYKDNSVVSPSWSNYNGLSSSNNTVLLDNSNTADSTGSIDFKIGAKAGNDQASGIYTGVINFTVVSNPAPKTLLDAYEEVTPALEQRHGYYKMQDMTTELCNSVEQIPSELQVIDIRDDKVYWIAKLADGNCWMTQNLDLDLDSNRTYTHWDTDLGWSTDNGNSVDESATWRPSSSTINFDGATTNQVTGWVNSNTEPYSANPGDIYYYTSNTEDNDIKYNSLRECKMAGHNDCTHYHAGNYYNWSAAVGSNDTSGMTSGNAPNSICPSGWRLPTYSGSNDFGALLYSQGVSTNITSNIYTENGFNLARKEPIYLVRAGGIWNNSITFQWGGLYFSNNPDRNLAYQLSFNNNYFMIYDNSQRMRGLSVRCLAR